MTQGLAPVPFRTLEVPLNEELKSLTQSVERRRLELEHLKTTAVSGLGYVARRQESQERFRAFRERLALFKKPDSVVEGSASK